MQTDWILEDIEKEGKGREDFLVNPLVTIQPIVADVGIIRHCE